MIKNKLLLVALLFVGISVSADNPDTDPEPSRKEQVMGFFKFVLGLPVVPIMIAGFGSQIICKRIGFKKNEEPKSCCALVNPIYWASRLPMVRKRVLKHRALLNKIVAVSSGYGLTRVIPGLKQKNEFVGIGSAIAAFLSIKDAN